MKLNKEKFLDILAQSRVVARACREHDPPISRVALYKAMRRDTIFAEKVKAILSIIAPKPPRKPLERFDSEGYILPVVGIEPTPIVHEGASKPLPLPPVDISPTPTDISTTLREPTSTICTRCHKTYNIPQDNSHSLICMTCNWSYNIKERQWHEIQYPYKRNSLEGILNGR